MSVGAVSHDDRRFGREPTREMPRSPARRGSRARGRAARIGAHRRDTQHIDWFGRAHIHIAASSRMKRAIASAVRMRDRRSRPRERARPRRQTSGATGPRRSPSEYTALRLRSAARYPQRETLARSIVEASGAPERATRRMSGSARKPARRKRHTRADAGAHRPRAQRFSSLRARLSTCCGRHSCPRAHAHRPNAQHCDCVRSEISTTDIARTLAARACATSANAHAGAPAPTAAKPRRFRLAPHAHRSLAQHFD